MKMLETNGMLCIPVWKTKEVCVCVYGNCTEGVVGTWEEGKEVKNKKNASREKGEG